MPKCTAHARRTHIPCQRWAMRGTTVCYQHGGATPRGIAAPSLKHGRYSKDLPTRVAADYRAAMQDENLLALRSEIALTDSRLADVLKRVDTGEAGTIWRDAQAALAKFEWEQVKQNTEGMRLALLEIRRLIRAGAEDYAAWHEVGQLIEQRRRLVESEQKRLITMQQMISSERAMLLLGVVVDVIRKHVTDRHTLANISAEFRALLAEPVSGAVIAG